MIRASGGGQREKLAGKVMEYIRDRLVISLPLLNRALLVMPWELKADAEAPPEAGCAFATDGERIYADADTLIERFRLQPDGLLHAYLHLVMHCMLSHPFHPEDMDETLWNLACDLAAEGAVLAAAGSSPDPGQRQAGISAGGVLDPHYGHREALPGDGMDPSSGSYGLSSGSYGLSSGSHGLSAGNAVPGLPEDGTRRSLLREACELAGGMSAERFYHWLKGRGEGTGEILRAKKLFRMDDHVLWLHGNGGGRILYNTKSAPDRMDENRKRWLEVSRNVKVENLSRQKSFGDQAGSRRRLLSPPDRDTVDYTEFLMKFAALEETVEINPDEFDYIYYTYGLSLYENLPLVEPLEYRDTQRIRDFVIAIDTSGSCQGPMVKSFLDKTFSILKNSHVFTDPMNLHIFMCDCEIQSDVRITGEEALDEYMHSLEVTGGGGTDFRPVFDKVDEYLRAGEFRDLRGLLYFTDGYGCWPDRKPDYRTAVIFVGEKDERPELPAWTESYTLRDEWLEQAVHEV